MRNISECVVFKAWGVGDLVRARHLCGENFYLEPLMVAYEVLCARKLTLPNVLYSDETMRYG